MTGVGLYKFSVRALKHRLGRGSNEYPQYMFRADKRKSFYLNIVQSSIRRALQIGVNVLKATMKDSSSNEALLLVVLLS